MFFADLDNFKGSLKLIDEKRSIDYNSIHFNLFEEIINIMNWKKFNPRLIRGYFYTGIYTDSVMKKIKSHKKKVHNHKKIGKDKKEKILRRINNCLEKSKENKSNQVIELKKDYDCNFLEFKKLPLQYSWNSISVFQKGVDVQLAVDLVSHAYQDNYDVAILCSGDVDLLESVKLVKNLGKKVIIVSHEKNAANKMIESCDYFYNLSNKPEDSLNKFSRVS